MSDLHLKLFNQQHVKRDIGLVHFFSWCVITHLRFRGYADRHRNVKIAGHWTKPWRHVMPIKAGLVSYKHNNVAPFVGSRCNKFEHDLCPGPSKSVLSKFLTCYLNITFQSRCRHKQGVNKNTREKQLHSLADTDCWPIGAIICFFKNSSNCVKVRTHSVISRNFSKTTRKGNLLECSSPSEGSCGWGWTKKHWLM